MTYEWSVDHSNPTFISDSNPEEGRLGILCVVRLVVSRGGSIPLWSGALLGLGFIRPYKVSRMGEDRPVSVPEVSSDCDTTSLTFSTSLFSKYDLTSEEGASEVDSRKYFLFYRMRHRSTKSRQLF